MTKDDIKLLCETDLQLQWWAMVLFAEIYTIASLSSGHLNENIVISDCVRAKVGRFSEIIIQRQLEKAKEAVKNEHDKT